MKLALLFCATVALVSCKAVTDKNDPLIPLYDVTGKERLKVREKALATMTDNGNIIPTVALKSENWAGDIILDRVLSTGLALGKGIVTSYIDGKSVVPVR